MTTLYALDYQRADMPELIWQKTKDFNASAKAMEENFNEMLRQEKEAYDNGQLVGRLISVPQADGRAWYQIIRENKNSVRIRVCIGIGDDWISPIWGGEATLQKKDMHLHLKRREFFMNNSKV